jgi:hypothetical protein
MALPETIRIKLSTEAAGAIALTPVVVRDLPILELFEVMLGITGKDVDRIRDLLRRGTLVNGASRFRWEGIEAETEAVLDVLRRFPDPDPSRPFDPARCERAVFRGANATIDMPKAVGSRRRFLRKQSYWDRLMEVAGSARPIYISYSYQERADQYRIQPSSPALVILRESASLLAYSSLADQIRRAAIVAIDLYTRR